MNIYIYIHINILYYPCIYLYIHITYVCASTTHDVRDAPSRNFTQHVLWSKVGYTLLDLIERCHQPNFDRG